MKTLRTLTIGALLAATALPAAAQLEKWGCNDEALANPQPMMEAVSLYQENVKQYKASKDQRYLQEAYPQWKTIIANVLNVRLDILKTEEGPSMGGAMLAAVANGEYASVADATKAIVEVVDHVDPTPELAAKYEERYQRFKQVYPTVKELFPKL